MDSDVQDPPGQQAAKADEQKGLRALFRKPRAQYISAADPGADDSGADGGGADDTGAADVTTADVTSADVTSADGGGPGTALSPRSGRRPGRDAPAPAQARPARRQPPGYALVSRPIINPRLRADPRLRVWVTRTIITALVYLGFMLWLGWRVGLTAAAVYAAADVIYRSKTTSVIPPAVRVTAAQRSTTRRLKMLQPAGYMALNARTIPGTGSVIDHVVIGPSGVFSLDSERMDKRLPLRAIGGMLYHGPVSQIGRLDHAREEAQEAAALIGAELGQRVKVHPAMVVYGPKIPWKVMRLKGVDVFDGGRVGTYFRHQSKATARHHLHAGQIAMLLAAADRALPPLGADPGRSDSRARRG